jgi:hypothetical protein
VDQLVLDQYAYLDSTVHQFRLKKEAFLKPKVKKGAKPEAVAPPTSASIVVAKAYPDWMQKTLTLLKPLIQKHNPIGNEKAWPNEKEEVLPALKNEESLKSQMKHLMTFVAGVKVNFCPIMKICDLLHKRK